MTAASSERGRPGAESAAPRPPLRSLLFVPGNRTQWLQPAVASGTDAIVLDLEDAVPPAAKQAAREAVASAVAGWQHPVPLFVRISSLAGPSALADLRAVVTKNLAGVLVPKISARADVIVADRLLDWCESENGLQRGTVALIPLLETASALWDAHGIASSAHRIAYLGALTVAGGDVERAVGFRWTPEGTETLALRSSVLLAARAAGTPNPVTGVWAALDDLAGLKRFADESRRIGYEGMFAIHPSQVGIINRAFTPTEAELARYQQIIDAVEAGRAVGRGTAVVDGSMVDEAMAVTARHVLARAVHWGGLGQATAAEPRPGPAQPVLRRQAEVS